METDSILNIPLFQEIQQTMPLWFQQGGVVMWILLLASFLSTIITLERIFAWLGYYLKRESFAIADCFTELNKQQKTQALKSCRTLKTPALNMLDHGIQALPFPPNEKMQAHAEKQISQMSRGQSLLDTIITLAPMLGILGTVLGIIDSFHILSLQGVDNPTAVVGGIAQALISTAMGLVVALSALLPYNLFRYFINKLTLHLELIGSEFNHFCLKNELISQKTNVVTEDKEESSKFNPEKASILEESKTVAEHSEMPYHYEFKKDSDEVHVKLHDEMNNINKTTQASLIEMYADDSDDEPEESDTDSELYIDEIDQEEQETLTQSKENV